MTKHRLHLEGKDEKGRLVFRCTNHPCGQLILVEPHLMKRLQEGERLMLSNNATFECPMLPFHYEEFRNLDPNVQRKIREDLGL